jgi:hypothetical protein
MELQLDATITVLLISKISSTCFGQTSAHLQEHLKIIITQQYKTTQKLHAENQNRVKGGHDITVLITKLTQI